VRAGEFGGDVIWELTKGPTDLVTNAVSVSNFIHTWNVYGLDGRHYDYGVMAAYRVYRLGQSP